MKVSTSDSIVPGKLCTQSTHQVDLYVAWVAFVWVDTTVCSVGTSVCLWCLVDDDVLDEQLLRLESLCLGVGLSVLEQVQQELDRLHRPSSCRAQRSTTRSET